MAAVASQWLSAKAFTPARTPAGGAANDRWVSNFDQFFVGASRYPSTAAHIVFIGSTPRLAEDVADLVPVFPPALRESALASQSDMKP